MHIAVAGNPNTGKTTLFNALTGLRMKVANYPGVTVEKREGVLDGTNITLLDLPGTYSLSARSPDEELARDIIQGRLPGVRRPDGVLIVADASNLERNLYLASQIIEFGHPTVVALNMADQARRLGRKVDRDALSRDLGVPVIPTSAVTGEGLGELKQALTALSPGACRRRRPFVLPEPFEQAAESIASALQSSGGLPSEFAPAGAVLWLMDFLSGDAPSRASAERFLKRLSHETARRLVEVAKELDTALPDAVSRVIEARYEWISAVTGRAVRSGATPAAREAAPSVRNEMDASGASDRIDRILTHRIWGLAIFAAVMFLFFIAIFAWADPLMSAVGAGQEALTGLVAAHMPDGALRSLITDGIIAGVGTVLTFFPQIFILFFCLGVLEDTGYLARGAFLMDRLMSRFGLHGRSFIPLMSSYACAIPGILATRTIEDRRDRFTTIMVAPLMSCSARLPVYVTVIAAVFGSRTLLAAGVMFGMYALGTVTALAAATLFKHTLFGGPRPVFIMELPPYRMPRLSGLLRATWDRSRLFLTNAGTVIFAVCVAIWALSYFPRTSETGFSADARARLETLADSDPKARDDIIAAERLRLSLLGRMGRLIEPTIEPLGFDWRIGIGILSSFLAREVFVGAMGITFAVGSADETSPALRDALAAASWPDGSRLMTPLAGISLMVFYVLACQCISTLAVVRKETGSWRWPAMMFAYMSVLAYVGALAVYQLGQRLGWG